jgi:thiamine-monophosphate kinase
VSEARKPTVGDLGEFPLIARLQRRFDRKAEGVVRGIGDDTAVLRPRAGWVLLATTDVTVEDIHFRRATIPPDVLGRRALAVNLSDIASMGGEPKWALVSLGLPSDLPVEYVDQLAAGLTEAADQFGAAIVGGNLATSPDRITIDVTLLGEVEPGRALYRNGARPGDRVLVTGFLGDSAAGFEILQGSLHIPGSVGDDLVGRHLSPTPRVEAGRAIAKSGGASAMIDLSDGLASDLGHILEESRVGAVVDANHIPLSNALREAAGAIGRHPLDWATRGGEDYELLLTAPPRSVASVIDAVRAVGVAITEIGEITATNEEWLIRPDGMRVPLRGTLWHHFSTP